MRVTPILLRFRHSSTTSAPAAVRAMSSSHSAPANPSSKLIFAPGEPDPSSSSFSANAQRAAQFTVGSLSRASLSPSPFTQFHAWFSDPRLTSTVPETCTLSTAELPSGRVSSRMVYLKELEDGGGGGGFVIYSNWATSRKARDLAFNPSAALCFWWKAVERQVRVEGTAQRLTREESQKYYQTRARGSRIGAWASRQSSVLTPGRSSSGSSGTNVDVVGEEEGARENNYDEDGDDDDGRAELDERVRQVERRFEGLDDIPVPEFWGGLRLVPDMVEFWQGRDSRLHDRFRYEKVESGHGEAGGEWKIERLSP